MAGKVKNICNMETTYNLRVREIKSRQPKNEEDNRKKV